MVIQGTNLLNLFENKDDRQNHQFKCLVLPVSKIFPIIIEESKEIIFFPTSSPRLYECCWVSLKNIDKYQKLEKNALVLFNNGYLLELDISYGSLDNQILRATRLESVLRMRKAS